MAEGPWLVGPGGIPLFNMGGNFTAGDLAAVQSPIQLGAPGDASPPGGGGAPIGGTSSPNSGYSLFGPGASTTGNSTTGYSLFGSGTSIPTTTGGGGFLSGLSTSDWVNIAGAVLGGYSGYQNAQASGQPSTSTTNQTTTQSPYGPSIEHLQQILAEQARLYGQGVPGGGGGGGGGQPPVGQYGTQAGGIYGQVAEAGLGAGSTPNMLLAQQALQGTLGGGGATGFEGYNPVLANLAQQLQGANLEMPTDLLLNFLGGNAQGGGPGGPGGGAGGGYGSSYSSVPGMVGGGGRPPDTGAGSGTFQTQIDRIFSEEANEEEIAAVLDSLRGDMERDHYGSIRDIEARAAGQGRSGGSDAGAEAANARARYIEKMGQISSQLRYGDLNARREARLAALNLLNNRDIASMADATNRAGINSSAASSAASTNLARELGLRGQDLDAIMGIMQGQQFGLSSLAGIGGQLSGDRTAALSLIPGLEGVGLAGQQNALGAAGGLTGLESLEQQSRDRAAAQARQRAAAPQNLLNDYLRTVLSVGSMGGTSTTQGTNVVPGTQISPFGGAAQGALGGYLATRGLTSGA